MHWAAHGQTAAEVIAPRAPTPTKPNMGLTSWAASRPRKADVGIAKNYLKQDEIEALNLIVSAYLDFAELQARGRKPMYMARLDRQARRLPPSERPRDPDPRRQISHEAALAKAQSEYDKFRAIEDQKSQPVDVHFEEAIEHAKRIAASKPKRKPKRVPK